MVDDKLVILTTYINPVEAEYWCSVLKDSGIEAFLDGAATGTALSHVGTALGGVKILVSEKELAIAAQILIDAKSSDKKSKPWNCDRCHETNEGSFEICWNCQQEKAAET